MVTALCHPTEAYCLLHGVWYLLCLPSGYLFLTIYSVCNLTDRSWGEYLKLTASLRLYIIVFYIYISISTSTSTCTCTNPNLNIYTYLYIYLYLYIYVYVHIYIYIYIRNLYFLYVSLLPSRNPRK